jgi:hypothetical protein
LSVAVCRDFPLFATLHTGVVIPTCTFCFPFFVLAASHPTSLAVTVARFSRVRLGSAREGAVPPPLSRVAVGSLPTKKSSGDENGNHAFASYFVFPRSASTADIYPMARKVRSARCGASSRGPQRTEAFLLSDHQRL